MQELKPLRRTFITDVDAPDSTETDVIELTHGGVARNISI